MQRSLARRYAPLAAIAIVQLLIIAVAPSKAPDGQELAALGGGAGVGGGAGGTAGGVTGLDGSSSAADGTTGATAGGGAAGGGAEGGGGGGGGGGAGGPAAGDTSHCVDGRQFDPAIDFHAPPCVPKWGGGDNGGATYQGVTADTITIVDYVGKGNDAVDAILKAQGAFVENPQRQAFDDAAADFINQRYELYGRKVVIKVHQGNCSTIPPDNACLREEMRQLVKDKKPYFFKWNSSLSSETYDELSRLGTPNAGGWHFRDPFAQARRPFHWDVMMSGTKLAQHMGEWYCKQLKPFPTKYAGTANPTENLNGRPRVLGVISTNDPENQATVQVDLREALKGCGAKYEHEYYYAQDITTADQQRRAAVLKMRENPVSTTVLCLCDLVAPSFLYAEEQQQNYYPENLIGGTGFMDADESSQAYMGTLGCPIRNRPCNFEDAFGLSSITAQEPENKDKGARVWAAAGREGPPPYNAVSADWDYWNMIASLIQGAGPNLNPATMEAGAFKQGFRGGGDTGQILRGFSPGNYYWNQDMRIVYWSTTKNSSRNNEAGTYVQIGPRYALGKHPSGELQLPGKPR